MGRGGDLSGVDESWDTLREAVARLLPALTALADRAAEA
jgi:hypothetical protein